MENRLFIAKDKMFWVLRTSAEGQNNIIGDRDK
jgi:hypothetical protein